MRKLVTLLCTVLAGSALFAQNTVLDVREAHPGKDLTMEEAIFKRVGYSIVPRDLMPKAPSPEKPSFTVFSENGSLYIKHSQNDTPVVIAESPDPGIVYGEIVSRNEFGINQGWFVSPDSTKVAFYKKDQSKVKRFPLLDISLRNGELKEIFYPMNGGPSEKVFVGIYDIPSGETSWLEVREFSSSRYITNISWSPD